MRKFLPIAAIGCAFIALVVFIVGGAIMLGYGAKGLIEKSTLESPPTAVVPVVPKAPAPIETRTLLEARQNFKTKLIANNYERGGDIPEAPAEAKIVRYGAAGLVAYLSKTKEKEKRPAVVFVHAVFGGVDRETWQQAKVFHDVGCVVMCPAFREENQNGGQFELFFGEVDDLLAAIEFVGKQPGVDANRVYVVGVGTGGTLALLAAEAGPARVRAFFAIGGHTDLAEFFKVTNGKGYIDSSPPFDPNAKDEIYLRSPIQFVKSIKQPAFFFEAQVHDLEAREALEMQRRGSEVGSFFRAFIVPKANAINIVTPTLTLISRKIVLDTGPAAIRIDFLEVARPFQN